MTDLQAAEPTEALMAGLATLPSDAARKTFLAACYLAMVGYDPFADDPNATIAEVAELFAGGIMERARAEAE